MKNKVTIQGKEIEKGKAHEFLIGLGFKNSICDINAFPTNIDPRWCDRVINIPEKKRGNLSKYAGKKCSVITTTIAGNGGARINFYIKVI